MIKLKEATRIMEQTTARGLPVPFHIVFCTADLNRKTGGEIITLDRAVLSRNIKSKVYGKSGNVQATKKPEHHRNRTRNLQQLQTSEIRKAHIDLILYLNQEEVV